VATTAVSTARHDGVARSPPLTPPALLDAGEVARSSGPASTFKP
jgi:hypothetical protein